MSHGYYQLTMDAKGRVAVPRKYRDRLEAEFGSRMVITPDRYEDCLAVYPLPEWRRFAEALHHHSDLKPEADDRARAEAEWACRLVLGNAIDCDIDSHGRLLIPPPLRAHAALTKHVRMICQTRGNTQLFELWDESKYIERSVEVFAQIKDGVRPAIDGSTSPAEASPAGAP